MVRKLGLETVKRMARRRISGMPVVKSSRFSKTAWRSCGSQVPVSLIWINPSSHFLKKYTKELKRPGCFREVPVSR